MSHTTADLGLHDYKNWQKNIMILPVGSILQWNFTYTGITQRHSIKQGQKFVISAMSPDASGIAGDTVYELTLVRGKKKQYWRAEGIAREIIDNRIILMSK